MRTFENKSFSYFIFQFKYVLYVLCGSVRYYNLIGERKIICNDNNDNNKTINN